MSEEMKQTGIPKGTPMISLPAKPLKPRRPEDVEKARVLAKRYLTVPMLEKMIIQKKENKEKKAAAKFKAPTSPEEFYERGEKYLNGALCAVHFQEKSKYYTKAAQMYAGAGEYQDAPELAKQFADLAEQTLQEGFENAYAEAVALKNKALSADDWFYAARAFERIPGYRDADAQADFCEQKLIRLQSIKAPMIATVLVLVVALIFGVVQYSKTDSFKLNAAKVTYAMGMDSLAANFLENLKDYGNTDTLLAEARYDNAKNHMKAGQYSDAASVFQSCGDYQDSVQLMEECSYYAGVQSMQAGNYKKAQKQFANANGFEDADTCMLEADQMLLENTPIGEHVKFGRCDCILLDVQDGKYLLLSAKLFGKGAGTTYHNSREAVTWENCDLRTAMNTIYLDEQFTTVEQAVIANTEIQPGVTDQAFLLSKEEYEHYLPVMGEKKANWWLRDSGEQPNTAMFVSCDGTVMEAGYPVDSTSIEGRPAFWVQFH